MTRMDQVRRAAWHLVPLLVVAAIALSLCRIAAAQGDYQGDPPDRVARLNYIQGSVSFQPAGTQDWVDASPNRPLTTGDNLWTDDNSRGELHIGSTALRLSSQTGISFLNLDDNATQIQLAQGSLMVHVRQLDQDEAFEVDTPNLAFSILRPGDYRISVDPDGGSSVIDVRAGTGEVSGGGDAFTLNPGQEYAFFGTDQLNYDARPLRGRDDFDNWCYSRDQREDQSISAHYVSREVIGYEDLDTYGSWRNNNDYGPVWIPNGVEAGWAPYQHGHWISVAPWGWTWVEDEPWGFAPFHYGRWVVIGGAWGWVPGPVAVGVVFGGPVVRPVYAPALVGFVGGGGFSATLVIGGGIGVAWFPLGPRDVWVPAYRCSPRYVQNVNIRNTRVVNVTQVTNVYNNVYINHNTTVLNNYTYARNTRAVTAVSRDTFVNGRPVSRESFKISQDQIQNPRINRQAAPFQPTPQSFTGGRPAARALPPAALANRTVVTRMTPAPQATPIGHTQSFAHSRAAFRPAVAPGSNNQPAAQAIQPNTSSPGRTGNSNNNRNMNNQPNNGQRPGFQPFQGSGQNGANVNGNNGGNSNVQPNHNANPSAQPNTNPNPNAQPDNTARPGFQPHNNGNGNANNNANPNAQPNSNANPSAQPDNNARPGFQPRSNGNGNGNGNNNANPNAQPTNNTNPSAQPDNATRPGFQPRSNGNGNGNGNNNANPSAQPDNNARPGFQPHNNGNANGNGSGNNNANPNAQPNSNASPSAQPDNTARPGNQPHNNASPFAKPPKVNDKNKDKDKDKDGKDNKDAQP